MQVTEELQEIRSLAREFAAAELRPHVEAWDRDAALGEGVLAQVAELGFFGMLAPESHGGMALGEAVWLAALEELAWGETGVAVAVAFHAQAVRLVAESGEALRGEWLERLAAGTALGCLAFAEGDAGLNLDAAATRARPDGDGWILGGSKRWVTNCTASGALLVLAQAPEGPTLFLVDAGDERVVRGERDRTLGLRPLDIRTLHFHDVRVADSARIGARGEALALLGVQAAAAARAIAAIAVGVAQAALDHAREYADVREQFGCKLRQFEGLQFKLADMATRVAAARALVERAVTGDDTAAAMAKVFAAAAAMEVSTQAVQVFGGYGYMRDYPVEKLMRDAKAMGLLGGADELHRLAIAASLYD